MKVIDMHCDTIAAIAQMRYEGKTIELRDNELNISLNKMKKGDNKIIPPISVTSFSISIMVFALAQLQNIDYR